MISESTRRAWPAAVWCLAAMALAVAGCAKPPPPAPKPPEPVSIVAPPEVKDAKAKPAAPVRASMVIVSSAETNPDRNGVPSPVVVRVYQLRRDVAFKRAAFPELFDNEKSTLEPDLITSDEFVLTPSDRKTLDVELAPEARYLGVLAAFRDYRAAQWQAIAELPGKVVSISLERARVVVTVK